MRLVPEDDLQRTINQINVKLALLEHSMVQVGADIKAQSYVRTDIYERDRLELGRQLRSCTRVSNAILFTFLTAMVGGVVTAIVRLAVG